MKIIQRILSTVLALLLILSPSSNVRGKMILPSRGCGRIPGPLVAADKEDLHMYSYEQRKKAVELYIQYGFALRAVIREL